MTTSLVSIIWIYILLWSSSKWNIFSMFMWTVKILVVVVMIWIHFKQDVGLLVKHLCIRFVSLHVFKEGNMIFNFTFSISYMIRLLYWWQFFSLAVIVLKSNFVLLRWIYMMVIIWCWLRLCSFFVLFLSRSLHL